MIRNAAKAVIVKDGHVLLTRLRSPEGAVFYEMPGGGQNPYESMEEAVIRECLEETGLTVCVERFLALYEEILTSEDFRAEYPDYAHRIFHVFLCRVTDAEAVSPSEQDLYQEGAEWVPIGDVHQMPLIPKALAERMADLVVSQEAEYLGARRAERMVR